MPSLEPPVSTFPIEHLSPSKHQMCLGQLITCVISQHIAIISSTLFILLEFCIMHSQNHLLILGLLARLIAAQQPTRTARYEDYSLHRRDDPPRAACPEHLGAPPMNCDSPACGGQSDNAGICKNFSGNGSPCQCQMGVTDAPTPTNTMVTTTDAAGSTIVGAYDLITLDKYKSLRQSQTVTVTQTTTGSNGQATVAAVVAVVAAGGVIWFLGNNISQRTYNCGILMLDRVSL